MNLLPDARVYLAFGSTDMRKAINGLSLLVEQALGFSPFSGDLFVFCNRQRTIVKILYWDHNGFCLWQKRLEEHRFKWPKTAEQVVTLGVKGVELAVGRPGLYQCASKAALFGCGLRTFTSREKK